MGIWDVHSLMEVMSSYQLAEWQAYFQIEPFGDARADLQAGVIASAVANTTRTKKSDPIWQPHQFLLRFEEQEKDPEAERERLYKKIMQVRQMFEGIGDPNVDSRGDGHQTGS